MGWEAIALVRNHCKRKGWNVFSSTFFLCCFLVFSFIKNNYFQLSCQFCWRVPSVDPWLNKGQGQSRDNSQLLWERAYSISMSCLHHFSVGVCHPTRSRELSTCLSPDRDCFCPWEAPHKYRSISHPSYNTIIINVVAFSSLHVFFLSQTAAFTLQPNCYPQPWFLPVTSLQLWSLHWLFSRLAHFRAPKSASAGEKHKILQAETARNGLHNLWQWWFSCCSLAALYAW